MVVKTAESICFHFSSSSFSVFEVSNARSILTENGKDGVEREKQNGLQEPWPRRATPVQGSAEPKCIQIDKFW